MAQDSNGVLDMWMILEWSMFLFVAIRMVCDDKCNEVDESWPMGLLT